MNRESNMNIYDTSIWPAIRIGLDWITLDWIVLMDQQQQQQQHGNDLNTTLK